MNGFFYKEPDGCAQTVVWLRSILFVLYAIDVRPFLDCGLKGKDRENQKRSPEFDRAVIVLSSC